MAAAYGFQGSGPCSRLPRIARLSEPPVPPDASAPGVPRGQRGGPPGVARGGGGLPRPSSSQSPDERSDRPPSGAPGRDDLRPAGGTNPAAAWFGRPAPPPRPPAVRQTTPRAEANAPREATGPAGRRPRTKPKAEAEGPKAENSPAFRSPREQKSPPWNPKPAAFSGRPRLITGPAPGRQAARPMEAWLPTTRSAASPPRAPQRICRTDRVRDGSGPDFQAG